MAGFINVRIINQTGALISDYNIESIQKVPVIMDVKTLAAGIYTIIFSNYNRSRLSCGRFVVIK
jgi:hypothetical protein